MIVSTAKHFVQAGQEAAIVVTPLGLDAKVSTIRRTNDSSRGSRSSSPAKRRAQNFSLGGYVSARPIPELKKQDIVYFPNTTSCGTATATSISHVFAVHAQQLRSLQGTGERGPADVLSRAGVDVAWFDNNTGSKGVADRVILSIWPNRPTRASCSGGECQDGVFLDKIDEWLSNVKKDSVLVLHQMGSHGLAYYIRYPKHFEIQA